MFHFFGRMRGNGRKAAQDYRLLDYAGSPAVHTALRAGEIRVGARAGDTFHTEGLGRRRMDVFAIEKGASAVDGTRRR